MNFHLSALSLLLVAGTATAATRMGQGCLLVKRLTKNRDGSDGFAWDCELHPYDANGRLGVKVRLIDINGNVYGLDSYCGGGVCRSGQTMLTVKGDFYDDTTWIQIENNPSSNIPEKAIVPENANPSFENNGNGNRRKLATTTGTKSVLVVRVEAPDSPASITAAAFSDSIFGTTGDPVNLKSQMKACSYDALTMNPAPDGNGVTDGVITLSLSTSVVGRSPITVMNAVTEGLSDNNIDSTMYDHIMVSKTSSFSNFHTQ
jgi:hypothetical protein